MRMQNRRGNPVSVCSVQRSRKTGFLIRLLPQNTALRQEYGYELLALSFDGTTPRFAENAKRESIAEQELTIYYDSQCPFIYQKLEEIRRYCEEHAVPVNLIQVDTLQKAKDLPCVFNNWGAFYKGKFVSVNLLDKTALISLILQNK